MIGGASKPGKMAALLREATASGARAGSSWAPGTTLLLTYRGGTSDVWRVFSFLGPGFVASERYRLREPPGAARRRYADLELRDGVWHVLCREGASDGWQCVTCDAVTA